MESQRSNDCQKTANAVKVAKAFNHYGCKVELLSLSPPIMLFTLCASLSSMWSHYLRTLLPVQINSLMPVTLITLLIPGHIGSKLLIAPVMSVWTYQNLLFNVLLHTEIV